MFSSPSSSTTLNTVFAYPMPSVELSDRVLVLEVGCNGIDALVLVPVLLDHAYHCLRIPLPPVELSERVLVLEVGCNGVDALVLVPVLLDHA